MEEVFRKGNISSTNHHRLLQNVIVVKGRGREEVVYSLMKAANEEAGGAQASCLLASISFQCILHLPVENTEIS